MPDKVGRANDVKDFVVVLAHEGELEAVFGRVDRDGARLGVAVEAVDDLALDAGKVDGLLERLDDAVVAARTRRVSFVLEESERRAARKKGEDGRTGTRTNP